MAPESQNIKDVRYRADTAYLLDAVHDVLNALDKYEVKFYINQAILILCTRPKLCTRNSSYPAQTAQFMRAALLGLRHCCACV